MTIASSSGGECCGTSLGEQGWQRGWSCVAVFVRMRSWGVLGWVAGTRDDAVWRRGCVVVTCEWSWRSVTSTRGVGPGTRANSSVLDVIGCHGRDSSQWDVNHGDIYIPVHFRGKRQGTLSLWRPWKSVEWGIMNWDVIMVMPYHLRPCTLALTPHGGLSWRG